MMQSTVKMTEEKAFEQDVRTMSYEELMASIRYLDHERKVIAKRVQPKSSENNDDVKKEVIKTI